MEGWVFLVSNAAVHDSTDRQSWKTDDRSVGRSVDLCRDECVK